MPATKKPRVMMVGVIPPPFHGQSIATKALFDADLSPIEKICVPIRSSKTIESVGKLSLLKALGLIPLVIKGWAAWWRYQPTVLYYTAGSGAWIPFIRDFVFLSLLRPLFRKTLIHYHSGNLQEFTEKSKFLTILSRFAYGRGAWTLRLESSCPAPSFPENRVIDFPNGLDAPSNLPPRTYSDEFRILFLGNFFKEKGILDLIDAVHKIASTTPRRIRLSLVGKWLDEQSRNEIETRLAKLPAHVNCPPPQAVFGEEKWQILMDHDVFVFPSYYSSENLPLVIIEAMAASLPVIATNWRGIPSLVVQDETGLLVQPRDVNALSSAILHLAQSPEISESMGRNGRRSYERSYTLEKHILKFREILRSAVLE